MAYGMPYYSPYGGNGYQYTQIPQQSLFSAPQTAQTAQTQQFPMQQQTVQNQANNGLIWVQGEQAAKSYPVASNSTVMLMDSEGNSFYLKTVDASGMPLPLRTFDYSERTTTAQAPALMEQKNNTEYVTRQEYLDLVDKYNAIVDKISGKVDGGGENAEQPVQPVKRKRQPQPDWEYDE